MSSPNGSLKIDTQSLWEKYEEIAMHFNDLLMQIRMRSLAGVAAVSTLVGVFADGGGGISLDWLVAAGLLLAVTLVWFAIFCLDYFYYSRMLGGAVAAIKRLEAATEKGEEVAKIEMSTAIEAAVIAGKPRAPLGVLLFYGIVFTFVFSATLFCWRMSYIEDGFSGRVEATSPPPVAAPSAPAKPS